MLQACFPAHAGLQQHCFELSYDILIHSVGSINNDFGIKARILSGLVPPSAALAFSLSDTGSAGCTRACLLLQERGGCGAQHLSASVVNRTCTTTCKLSLAQSDLRQRVCECFERAALPGTSKEVSSRAYPCCRCTSSTACAAISAPSTRADRCGRSAERSAAALAGSSWASCAAL